MEDKEKEKKSKKSPKDFFAKLIYLFAKFSWFFGIIIAVIVLLTLYRFIIQPQYQKIINRQEEIRQLNLEGEREKFQQHLVSLQEFITLSDAITDEEIQSLNKLLSGSPDLLVLQIQFKKILDRYNVSNTSITLGEVTFLNEDAEEEVSVDERERIVDLSSFFEEPEDEAVDDASSDDILKVESGQIPISISATFIDYHTAKDFINEIEQLTPLVDFQSIDLTIDQTEEEDGEVVAGGEADESGPIAGSTTISLSGVIQIAAIK